MHPAPDTTPALRALIRNKGVRAVFQPIVDLDDGMVMAFEALARPDPVHGFQNPDELFHAAESAGFMWELEEVTRAVAIDAAVDWPRDIRLFLNTSPSVFADERFVRSLEERLERASAGRVTPAQVVLEITERGTLEFDEQLLARVAQARERGFQIAIDDAGAGASGLNRLMLIRPQWIKLDRHLISGIHRDPLKQNLLRSFANFARMSGVSVIAEGIEAAEELSTLMGLGIRYAQGYFLGRPAARDATTDPTFIAQVRDRWASVEASMPADPHALPMARLCTDTLVAETSSAPVGELACKLLADPDAPGVVVSEGRRLVGWADRDRVLAASAADPRTPVAAIVRPAACALSPEATLQEALRFACTREDDDLSQPIIIGAGPHISGVVPIRELLRAAAAEGRHISEPSSAALPGRVLADQQLERMIAAARASGRRGAPDAHADVCFIDVRRFAEYNTVFGYRMGDRLIRMLGEQIESAVVRGSGEVFLAHLGDDRFMLTAPTGLLEPRVRLLLRNFEVASGALTNPASIAGGPEAAPDAAHGPRLGLRILLLPGVFDRAAHPREIYRIEQQLRQKARTQEQTLPPGESLLVADERATRALARLSA